jgi:hypothetical protein
VRTEATLDSTDQFPASSRAFNAKLYVVAGVRPDTISCSAEFAGFGAGNEATAVALEKFPSESADVE